MTRSLAHAAAGSLRIGCAVAGGGHHSRESYPDPFTADTAYRELLGREFTSLSAENQMKWDHLRPAAGEFDFSESDAIVDFAHDHDQVVRGHTLLWHNQNPVWLEDGGYSPRRLRALLQEHIETVVGRYAGRIHQWDVANEIFDDRAELRLGENIWLRELGPGIISEAFRWAQQADPTAQLFLNDYNVEGLSAKSDAYHRLAAELLADGVPLHGFSTQGHLSIQQDFPAELAENLRRFEDLGLRTAITELDVRIALPPDGRPTAQQLALQAEYYRRATEAALEAPGCESLTLWGVLDRYSWVPGTFPGEGAATVLWDDLSPKPAYAAVREALAGPARTATAAQ